MILKLIKNLNLSDDIIYIKYREMNQKIAEIIEVVNDNVPFIVGIKGECQHHIELHDILYFESVDKRVYAYTSQDVFLCDYSLKELESNLASYHFVRISKPMIINFFKVKQIKADANMKLLVYLINDEAVMITRHYRNKFYDVVKHVSQLQRELRL